MDSTTPLQGWTLMMFMACSFAVATLTKMLAIIVSPWLPKRQSNVAQLKKWSFYGTICASCATQTGLFFATMDQDPGVILFKSDQNIADEPERFNRLVATTMNDTVTQATNATSGGKKFAVEEVYFTKSLNLYSLAQCTPDLSSSDCNRCLRIAISILPSCCSQKPGASMLYPSCIVRYETFKFF